MFDHTKKRPARASLAVTVHPSRPGARARKPKAVWTSDLGELASEQRQQAAVDAAHARVAFIMAQVRLVLEKEKEGTATRYELQDLVTRCRNCCGNYREVFGAELADLMVALEAHRNDPPPEVINDIDELPAEATNETVLAALEHVTFEKVRRATIWSLPPTIRYCLSSCLCLLPFLAVPLRSPREESCLCLFSALAARSQNTSRINVR
eukprot:SAG22_NODE_746_length_7496_cov_5.066513_5_plen_209_part_00